MNFKFPYAIEGFWCDLDNDKQTVKFYRKNGQFVMSMPLYHFQSMVEDKFTILEAESQRL